MIFLCKLIHGKIRWIFAKQAVIYWKFTVAQQLTIKWEQLVFHCILKANEAIVEKEARKNRGEGRSEGKNSFKTYDSLKLDMRIRYENIKHPKWRDNGINLVS